MRFLGLTFAGLMASSAALAGGDALIIGNSRYGAVQSFFGAARVIEAADQLAAVGVDVTEISDADGQAMDDGFAEFVEGVGQGDAPLIVVLAGAFMHGPGGAYLLPVDDGRRIDAAEVLTRGFPIDAAMAVLARAPGRAFLVLGETAGDLPSGPYLRSGLGKLEAPQGVTIIRGLAPDVAAFAARDMARPGVRLQRAARRYELKLDGFLPEDQVILRQEDVSDPIEGLPPGYDPLAAEEADNAAWRLAQQADSAESYNTYLRGFPEGLHASAARQRLSAIRAEPFYAERRAEEALALSRDARRAIQRDLTILGFNTRGVDGIFGPGTRKAISEWQQGAGLTPSSYIDQPQIARLSDAARARAAALEEEARRRAEEQARRDDALWSRTQAQASEELLRQYLREYPEGRHAGEARQLLQQLEDQRAGRAAEQDRRAWQLARERDTVAAYRKYLKDRPGGSFINEARARITELNRASEQERAIARAQAEENALGLTPVARRLAEARLKSLGFKPGEVDGRFGKKTRRAIRNYQRTHGLTITGYLDEKTVVRLLADGILGR